MKTAFVVLGMHRSGTSSVAGALSLLGAAAPRTLMSVADDNPKGFWESEVVMMLNDRILEAAGSSWRDWRRLDPVVFAGGQGARFHAEATKALIAEFATAETIVLKDPIKSSICSTHRLWPCT